MTAESYQGYAEWKQWGSESFAICDPEAAAYFAGEMRGRDLRGKLVLELGFGNGRFLAFARAQGATVYGTELIPEAVELAKEQGVRIFAPDLSDAVAEYAGAFDIVVAFDLFEHLYPEDIQRTFAQLAILLREGGVVIARFPNGGSPFGGVSQYGDHTHRTFLSASLLMQLLIGQPWRLKFAGNPYRSTMGSSLKRRIGLVVRHKLRDLIEFSVNRIWGMSSTMDPNVVVVIEKVKPAFTG